MSTTVHVGAAANASRVWDAHAPRSPDWADSVRALAPDARREILARADAAAAAVGGPERDERVSMAVYAALQADLDPADPRDCARIARMIADGPAFSFLDLMRRTAAHAADAEVGECARLVLAQQDLLEGRTAEAERAYVEAMRAATGRWPTLRSSAAIAYARLCLDERRDVEALLLARRGSAACAETGDRFGALYGRLVETYVLLGLEDWPRLGAAISSIEAELPGVSPRARGLLEYGISGVAAELALGEGRGDDALAWIETCERLATARKDIAWNPCEVNLVRAAVLVSRGRDGEALDEIESGLAAGTADEGIDVHLRTWRVRLLAKLGRDELGDAAEDWLRRLAAGRGARLGPGVVLRAGTEGGEALRATGRHAELARRAYRLAAAAALARLADIECFMRKFPEFAVPTDEERATIADHRARTEARAEALNEAVAALLLEEVAAGRWPLAALAPPDGFVACCAWCARLRSRDGAWLPLPETLPSLPQDAVALTHGICGDCTREMCPNG